MDLKAKIDALIANLEHWYNEEDSRCKAHLDQSNATWASYHNGNANGLLVALSNLRAIRDGRSCPGDRLLRLTIKRDLRHSR